MPDWIAAIILGMVEGITEFLPISSTGHLLIAERWFQMPPDLVKDDLFNIVIQCGTVLAVLLVFATRSVCNKRCCDGQAFGIFLLGGTRATARKPRL